MAERSDSSTLARIQTGLFAVLIGTFGLSTASLQQAKKQDAPSEVAKALDRAGFKTSAGDSAGLPAKVVTPPSLEPLAYFLGMSEPGAQSVATLQAKVKALGYTVESLVAIIPDPDTVSYGNYTNQGIESILRAAEASDFGYDRHWLPWSGDPPEESVRNFRPRDSEPGVLLFRKIEGEKTKLLLVFLTGETPTSGIQREQFRRSARQALLFGGTEAKLRIAGPTYSGSAPSLRDAIRETAALGGVSVVSGTVTGVKVPALFAPGTFITLPRNDASASDALREYYKELYGPRVRITSLQESGSDYGAQAQAARKPQEQSVESLDQDVAFPMSISRVRNAYQSDPMLRDMGAQSEAGARNRLQFKLDQQKAAGYDKIPDFGAELTPYSQDLALERVVDKIAAFKPRLLNLFASDIRDLLFLGSYLRNHYSRTRIVLYDADVLYSNQSSFSFDGALSLSSFEPDNGDMGYRFSSMTGQGMFFAVHQLLSGKPSPPLPTWLTVYGHGRNWPVAMLPLDASASGLDAARAHAGKLLVSVQTSRVNLALGLLLLTLVLAPRTKLSVPGLAWSPHSLPFPDGLFRQVVYGLLSVIQAGLLGIMLTAGDGWRMLVPLGGMALAAASAAATGFRSQKRGWLLPPALLAVWGAASACLLPGWLNSLNHGKLAGDFYAYRAVPLGTGVSPLCPLVLLAAVAILGALTQLAVRRYGAHSPRYPEFHGESGVAFGCALVWISISVWLLDLTYIDTLEGRVYNRLFAGLMGAAYWATAYAVSRMLHLLHNSAMILLDLERDSMVSRPAPVPGGKYFWNSAGPHTFGLRKAQISQARREGQDATRLEWTTTIETLVASARCQVYFLSAAVVLLMGVFQWYPFQPAEKFINYVGGTLLICGGAAAFMFVRLERLRARSPLYTQEVGEFSWESILKFGTTILAPLLFLLASLFPQYGRTLFQYVLPVLSTAK